jgi:hypothetical protein
MWLGSGSSSFWVELEVGSLVVLEGAGFSELEAPGFCWGSVHATKHRASVSTIITAISRFMFFIRVSSYFFMQLDTILTQLVDDILCIVPFLSTNCKENFPFHPHFCDIGI